MSSLFPLTPGWLGDTLHKPKPSGWLTQTTSAARSSAKAIDFDSLLVLQDMMPPPTPPRVLIVSTLHDSREQFRFPRSKKRRIRKKWAKNPRNSRPKPWPVDGQLVRLDIGDGRITYIANPRTARKVQDAVPGFFSPKDPLQGILAPFRPNRINMLLATACLDKKCSTHGSTNQGWGNTTWTPATNTTRASAPWTSRA